MAEEREGRSSIDDDVRKVLKRFSSQRDLLQQVSRPEQLVDVLDTVSENSEAITHAVETLVAVEESGMLDMIAAMAQDEIDEYDPADASRSVQEMHTLLVALSRVDANMVAELGEHLPDADFPAEEWDAPDRVGILGSLVRMRDPEVQRGLGRLFVMLRMLGGETVGAARQDD